jgi:hypothetical protein
MCRRFSQGQAKLCLSSYNDVMAIARRRPKQHGMNLSFVTLMATNPRRKPASGVRTGLMRGALMPYPLSGRFAHKNCAVVNDLSCMCLFPSKISSPCRRRSINWQFDSGFGGWGCSLRINLPKPRLALARWESHPPLSTTLVFGPDSCKIGVINSQHDCRLVVR